MSRIEVSSPPTVESINNHLIESQSLAKKVMLAAFAVIFASVIIGAVGFAPGYAHNAAHDTRHVMVFPCH